MKEASERSAREEGKWRSASGEGSERRGGVGAIGARGMKVAARAMERGRGEAGERRGGVGVIGARGTKVAARAMERGRGEAGERRGGVGANPPRDRRAGNESGSGSRWSEVAARAASAEDARCKCRLRRT